MNKPDQSNPTSATQIIVPLPPARCPSIAKKRSEDALLPARRWVSFSDLHREPFRLFFPTALMAGLIGVALWPIMLLGWTSNYPGPSHARLMVQGFFGGFIFGFMGTAMPRLVGARPLSAREAFSLLVLLLGNVAANTIGMNTTADLFFVGEITLWFGMLRNRCHTGNGRPPPSFALVGLSFASAIAGTVLHLAGRVWELSDSLEMLARLLGYHAFVLLCILGAGGFLLPRFLGLGLRRTYPASEMPSPEWKRSALIAKTAGGMILSTYALESMGWNRFTGTIRAGALIAYLCYEVPLERLRWNWRGTQWQLIVGLVCIPAGIMAAGWFSYVRVSMLHVELIGGFALITTGTATRVVFGHSGARNRLEKFQAWLTASAALMLVGLVSRITGDFAPQLQSAHYLYGAVSWLAGAMIWAVCVLPRVMRPDSEN